MEKVTRRHAGGNPGAAPAAPTPAQSDHSRRPRPVRSEDAPALPDRCLLDHTRALVGAVAGAMMDMADVALGDQDETTCPCTCGRCFRGQREMLSRTMAALAVIGDGYSNTVRDRTTAPSPRDLFEDIPDLLREIARQWRQVRAQRRERERWYARKRKEQERAEKLPPKG